MCFHTIWWLRAEEDDVDSDDATRLFDDENDHSAVGLPIHQLLEAESMLVVLGDKEQAVALRDGGSERNYDGSGPDIY